MNSRKTAKRFLSFIIAMGLLTGLFDTMEVQAAVPIQRGIIFDANSFSTKVGFAGYQWHAIGYDGAGIQSQSETLTLLAVSSDFGMSAFDSGTNYVPGRSPGSNIYEGSLLHQAMTDIYDGVSLGEKKWINPVTLDDLKTIDESGFLAGQYVWPLSEGEKQSFVNQDQQNVLVNFADDTLYFFTRTASPPNIIANGVYTNKGFASCGINFHNRPALQLDLSDLLFTSDAVGGKNVIAGGPLTLASTPAGPIKLTMIDENQSLDFTPTHEQVVQTGATLVFDYENATTGANQYISCYLENQGAGGNYFGRLMDAGGSSAAQGSVSVPLTGVDNGTYILYIFSEQDNGDNYTDFASRPVTMTVTVSGGQGTVEDYALLTGEPDSVSFGSVTIDSTETRTVNIKGTNLTKDISYAVTNGSAFTVAAIPGWDVTSGGALQVSFSPDIAGYCDGALSISAPGVPDVIIILEGTGIPGGGPSSGSSSSSSSGGGAPFKTADIEILCLDTEGNMIDTRQISGVIGSIIQIVPPEIEGYLPLTKESQKYIIKEEAAPVTFLYEKEDTGEPEEPQTNTEEAFSAGGYISGYPDKTFRPDNPVTRGEAAAMLHNLIGNDPVPADSGSAGFTDVAPDDWYSSVITELAAQGLISGYPQGGYQPDAPLTRAEITVMALRLKGIEPAPSVSSFPDVRETHWAAAYITEAERLGVISGYPDGSFSPDQPVTRAEAVTILNKITGRTKANSRDNNFSDVPVNHWAYGAIQAAAMINE